MLGSLQVGAHSSKGESQKGHSSAPSWPAPTAMMSSWGDLYGVPAAEPLPASQVPPLGRSPPHLLPAASS